MVEIQVVDGDDWNNDAILVPKSINGSRVKSLHGRRIEGAKHFSFVGNHFANNPFEQS